jgi:hypothetical protein
MRRTLVAVLFLPAPILAQSSRLLGTPTAEANHEFSRIAGVRELPDGRVLVSDSRDNELQLVDFAARTARQVGRQGAGPSEYARVGGLLALSGGRSLLLDPGNERMLELGPAGAITRTLTPSNRSKAGGSLLGVNLAWDARGVDRNDLVYFDQGPPPLKPGESRSVPIVRWNPRSGALETVASYMLSEAMLSQSLERQDRNVVLRPRAWVARPRWVVASDGAIALVEPSPYRVTWIANARRSAGPPVAYTPLAVTAADREAFLEELRGVPTGPSGRAYPRPAGAPAPLHKVGGEPLFPETRPPFEGRDAVWMAPDGTVWVSRSRSATDTLPRFDVFDRSGTRVQEVVVSGARRLVGFGVGTVYLARRDSDDLEHLERYKLP